MARVFALSLLATAAAFTGSTHAASLNAQQTLEQFNVVTLGNMTTTSHVDGRSYVSGSVSGQNAVFGMHPEDMPASNYAALTVMGKGVKAGDPTVNNVQVTDNGAVVYGEMKNSTVNNGHSAVYGVSTNSSYNGSGSVYASGNYNGGNVNVTKLGAVTAGTVQATNTAAATSTDFGYVLGELSSSLSTRAATGGTVDFYGTKATFNAKVVNGIAVFDLDSYTTNVFDFTKVTEFAFNLNGAATVIMNSSITTATIGANFLADSAHWAGSALIWNFYAAENLTINAQFGGSILALGADLLQNSNANIEGGVYVDNLDSRAEIHLNPFIGAVPEPETYAMMLAGLGLVGFIARRRRSASSSASSAR